MFYFFFNLKSLLRENIVKNHGIANNSGIKLMSAKCLANTGS